MFKANTTSAGSWPTHKVEALTVYHYGAGQKSKSKIVRNHFRTKFSSDTLSFSTVVQNPRLNFSESFHTHLKTLYYLHTYMSSVSSMAPLLQYVLAFLGY